MDTTSVRMILSIHSFKRTMIQPSMLLGIQRLSPILKNQSMTLIPEVMAGTRTLSNRRTCSLHRTTRYIPGLLTKHIPETPPPSAIPAFRQPRVMHYQHLRSIRPWHMVLDHWWETLLSITPDPKPFSKHQTKLRRYLRRRFRITRPHSRKRRLSMSGAK